MNRKQFIKLIILVSITFLFSLIVAIKTQQIAINIVNSLSAILPLVFGFSLAIVIYLITLSDSISSKIQSISIDQESTKIKLDRECSEVSKPRGTIEFDIIICFVIDCINFRRLFQLF